MNKVRQDDRDFQYGDDMLNPIFDCRNFARRRDVSSFNMTNFLSCENCRHMTADNRCSIGADLGLPRDLR